MKILRKGARGPKVGKLQENLIAAGFQLKTDQYFWNNTDKALRTFQRKNGLIPDGIAGDKTWTALDAAGKPKASHKATTLLDIIISALGRPAILAAQLAKYITPTTQASQPVAQFRTSKKGYSFIYTAEAYPGISNYLHWPGGSSGVTLGPGYDMKERTEAGIIADLTAIGVDRAKASKVAKGARLTNKIAQDFATNNRKLIKLTGKDEIALLKNIVPRYEALVKRHVTIDLMQHEFDALVCFAYNPGKEFIKVANFINHGKVASALKTIKNVIHTGGSVNQGLINRREKEVTLYLYNDYGKLRTV